MRVRPAFVCVCVSVFAFSVATMPTPSPVKADAQAQGSLNELRPGALRNGKKGPEESPGGKPPVKAARVEEGRAI